MKCLPSRLSLACLLLPVSSKHLRVMRGARWPGFRTVQNYSNYKRFLTSVEIKETDDKP